MAYSVKQISDKVRSALSDCHEVIAALLMGSCSRGEETYFANGSGERELLSDYEMLIIVKDNSKSYKSNQKLQKLADELKQNSSSPCFDLEWSYKTVHEMRTLDKRFIFFEAKASACVIYGDESALALFPDITIHNLNYCELNTILIHRLYHVIRDCMVQDEHYQKYLIARNTLDIPTAILPLLGILQSSYECRNITFRTNASKYGISKELLERLDSYLLMKKDYDALQYNLYSLNDMRKQFIEDMQFLYEFQKKIQNGHAFKKNHRLLLSGIYRCNTGLIRKSFQWEKINESLYNRMLCMLKTKNLTRKALDVLQNEMYDIYNYK